MIYKRGQALLIAIMLLATAITIALAITYRSTTDTQLTKLEEESQRALAAAEAGIEAAIRSNSNVTIADLNLGVGFSGSATIDTTSNRTNFISPNIEKDGQYAFYLAKYDPSTNAFTTNGANRYNGTVRFYFGTNNKKTCNGTRNAPALEVTLVKVSGTIERLLIEPCSSNKIGTSDLNTNDNGTLDGVSFDYFTETLAISNEKLMFVRVFYSDTKIGIKGNNALPLQGRIIVSEATSPGGVTKKVQLFQSYPQIPAEFFVTQF